MFWFVAFSIGFVVCLVLAVLSSFTPRPEDLKRPDPSLKDIVTGKAMQDWNDDIEAQHTAQSVQIFLWIFTVIALIGAIVTGINVFGG